MMMQQLARLSDHVPPPSAPRMPLDPAAVVALVRAARDVPTEQLLGLATVRVQSLLMERGQAPLPAPSSRSSLRLAPGKEGGAHG
jgi:hypothetical protein